MQSRQQAPNKAFFQQGPANGTQALSTAHLKKKFQSARATGNLNLSSCNPALTIIPKEVFFLDQFLEENEKFWEVEVLKSLDLSFNGLSAVPNDIANLAASLQILKLRNNRLTSENISEQMFQSCVLLRLLDLSYNQLQTLSPAIAHLVDLKDLNLSNNQLHSIPGELWGCTSLCTLDISNNKLASLSFPSASFSAQLNYQALISLNLSNNSLTAFPAELIAKCSNLETLHLQHNQLRAVPSLASLNNLQSLDLSQNALAVFPTLPANCNKLVQLVLSYNFIEDIPLDVFKKLNKLSEFLFHNNKLSQVPPEIEFMSALKILDLSNNNLQDLPCNLGYITPLQILKVEGNCIKTIRQTMLIKPSNELKTYLRTRGPSIFSASSGGGAVDASSMGKRGGSVGQMHYEKDVVEYDRNDVLLTQIQYRVRDSCNTANSFSNASQGAGRRGGASTSNSAASGGVGVLDFSTLQLNDAQLESYSDQILDFIAQLPSPDLIRSLNLTSNKLQHLPLSLMRALANQLTTLTLASNQLHQGNHQEMLTSDVGYRNVQAMDISSNSLLSTQFDHLIAPFRLSTLIAHHNHLSILSSKIQYHRDLRMLDLSHCHLKDIQVLDVSLFPALEHLDLSNNKIVSLQANRISSARQMQFLSIENNELKEIPTVLGALPNIRTLLVGGNPQKFVSHHIIQQGSAKVIEYLKAKYVPTLADEGHLPPATTSDYDNYRSAPGSYNYETESNSRGGISRGVSSYPEEQSQEDLTTVFNSSNGYKSSTARTLAARTAAVPSAAPSYSRNRNDDYPDSIDNAYGSKPSSQRQTSNYRSAPPSASQAYDSYEQNDGDTYMTSNRDYGYGQAVTSTNSSRRAASASTAIPTSNTIVTKRPGYYEQDADPYPQTQTRMGTVNNSNASRVIPRGGGNQSSLGDILGGGSSTASYGGGARSQRTDTLRNLNAKRLG